MVPNDEPAVAKPGYTKIGTSGLSYRNSDPLGKGGFGVVYLGLFNNREVAIKRIVKDALEMNDRDKLTREIDMQMKLKDNNVLQLIKYEENEDFSFLVLELCWGSLKEVIEIIKVVKKKPPLFPSDVEVLYQIASGLHYIHSQRLVHRDIKPENILVSNEAKIKISDFGFTKPMNSSDTYSVSEVKGTSIWMASELFKSTGESIRGTSKSDVFSAGCVFFFFLTAGIHPFGEDSWTIQLNIVNKKPAANINQFDCENNFPGALDIIRKMIMHEPTNRPSFLEVKQFIPLYSKDFNPLRRENRTTIGVFFRGIELSPDICTGISCIRFHPAESYLACVKTEDGVIIVIDGNDFSSRITSFSCHIGGAHIPVNALEWNVNGTQRVDFVENSPTEWKDDLLIWKYSYPNQNEIMFQGKELASRGLAASVVVWNPFDPDILATYKKELSKELRIWKSVNYSKFHSHSIKTNRRIDGIEWIARNQIACCYYHGSESVTEIPGGIIKVYQLEFDDEKFSSSKLITQFNHSAEKIEDLAWNKEKKLLASCSIDGWIKVWSLENCKLIKDLKEEVGCVSLTWCPNKKIIENQTRIDDENPLIVCGLSNGSILIWSPLESEVPLKFFWKFF